MQQYFRDLGFRVSNVVSSGIYDPNVPLIDRGPNTTPEGPSVQELGNWVLGNSKYHISFG